MNTDQNKTSLALIIFAFTIVYVVWGSTYFFIQIAVKGFPPMLLGALRYTIAGVLMLAWCYFRGDKLWVRKNVITSAIGGLLTLFIATGVVFVVEKTLPSSIVGIMVSANPIWFLVLDKPNWRANFSNKTTHAGTILGFAGVLLLFGEALGTSFSGIGHAQLIGLVLLLISPIAWCGGSLISKNRGSSSPARLNSAWQMVISGLAFVLASLLSGESKSFHFAQVSAQAWWALSYLIVFGSIAAFSAYVWLLSVRSATQVSTHSYVNPVIAVLLGVLFAGEHVSALQLGGLLVILFSLLLINLKKYKIKLPRFSIFAKTKPTVMADCKV